MIYLFLANTQPQSQQLDEGNAGGGVGSGGPNPPSSITTGNGDIPHHAPPLQVSRKHYKNYIRFCSISNHYHTLMHKSIFYNYPFYSSYFCNFIDFM